MEAEYAGVVRSESEIDVVKASLCEGVEDQRERKRQK